MGWYLETMFKKGKMGVLENAQGNQKDNCIQHCLFNQHLCSILFEDMV